MAALVIVESPGKVKKIAAILGAGYEVAASVGHVRDLPAKEMGVDIAGDFAPQYVFIPPRPGKSGKPFPGGRDRVARLAHKAQYCDRILLATDPDREGEAIAWHLAQTLHLKHAQRITFESITAGAVRAALKAPRAIDLPLVRAQEARRVLDRLVGYTASPAVSRCVGLSLSAGRVQSPAVRLVVERERAIAAFQPTEHYTAALTFDARGTPWTATWDTAPFLREGERYFTRKDLAAKVATVREVEVAQFEAGKERQAPPAPFTTSTLQQGAQAALKFRPKTTMALAQKLYEQGAITYHRTDTPNLSPEGFAALAAWARQAGVAIVSQQRVWKAKAGAQEAHEAIRPSHFEVQQAGETPDQQALYALIRRRAIASQMPDAVYAVRTAHLVPKATLGGKPVAFVARGKTLAEPGWRALYAGSTKAASGAKPGEAENPVPNLQPGASLRADDGRLVAKTTQPPARYTQATLVKAMERREIGRPSTYAAILDAIVRRGYIEEDKKSYLHPLPPGEAIVAALAGTCSFIDLDYTRALEAELDAIAHGKAEYLPVVRAAYQRLTAEIAAIHPVRVAGIEVFVCPTCGHPMRKRKGPRGMFWGCGNYPDCKTTAPDADGKPDLAHAHAGGKAEPSRFPCHECGAPLVHRTGTSAKGAYDFWGCSAYPRCRATYRNGADGTPVYPEAAGRASGRQRAGPALAVAGVWL